MKETLTDIVCPECGERVFYEVVHFLVRDYPDWRLHVECGCGEVTDKEILKQVRNHHGEQIGRKIAATQEAAMASSLGFGLNARLNRVLYIQRMAERGR